MQSFQARFMIHQILNPQRIFCGNANHLLTNVSWDNGIDGSSKLSRMAAKICLNGSPNKDVTQATPTIFSNTPQWLIVEYTLLILNSEGANTLPPSTLVLTFEGAQAAQNHSQQLIVASKSSKVSLHFCKYCRIFCEGVKDHSNTSSSK